MQGIYNLTGDVPMKTSELMDRLFEKHGLPKISWDASLPSVRSYNARLSNRKIKAEGFELIYPEIKF